MRRRAIRIGLLVVGVLLLAAVSAAALLVRTNSGRDLLKDEALTRLRASISGDVQIARVASSSNLLRGVTLYGVLVTDPEGGAVLEADSVRASYSLMSLISRKFVSRLSVWSPTMTVRRMPDGTWNVLEAFRRPPAPAQDAQAPDSATASETGIVDTVGTGFRAPTTGGYEVDRLEIFGGTVRIAADGAGEGHRWTVYDSVTTRLDDLRVGAEGSGERGTVERLALIARFEAGDLHVRDLVGRFEREGTTLVLEGERLALPGSEGTGTGTIDWGGAAGPRVDLAIDAERLDFADLGWLPLALPRSGRASGQLRAEMRPEGASWRLSDITATAGDGRARGTIAFETGARFRFTDVSLELAEIDRSVIATWLPADFPVERVPEWVSGTLTVAGSFDDLSLDAALALRTRGVAVPSPLQISGRILGGDAPGARGLRMRSESIAFPALAALLDLDIPLSGRGSFDIELDGQPSEGLQVAGYVSQLGDLGGSTLRIDGRFRRQPDDSWSALGSLGLRPLALSHVDPFLPGAGLKGSAVGEVRFQGELRALRISTDLNTSGGPLAVEAMIDVLRPAAGLTVSGTLDGFDVAAVSDRVPDPTELRGDVALENLRTVGASLTGAARLTLQESRFGSLRIPFLHLSAEAADGILTFDSLRAETSAVVVAGSGSLPLTPEGPPGEVRVAVRTESLGGLRPFLLGDTVIAGDTLNDLERDMLISEGIDPDTLQSAEALQMAGRAEGELVLRGRVDDLTVEGAIRLEEAVYGRIGIEQGTLTLTEFTYPGRRLRGTLVAGRTSVYNREFAESHSDLEWENGRGTLSLGLVQSPTEDVRMRGTFEVTELESTWFMDELTVRLDGERWNLGGPAVVRWGEAGFTLQDVRFIRPGVDGFRLTADGTIPRRGELDLEVSVRRLDMERMSQLFQLEQRAIRGEVDADLRIAGVAAAPIVDASLSSQDFGYEAVDLSDIGGRVRYSDRQLEGELIARHRRVGLLSVSGSFPAEISFSTGFQFGVPDAPVALTVVSDSIPLEHVLGFFPGYDDVEGRLDGRIVVGGTPSDLEPRGELRLVGGAVTLAAFGIRPEGVQGTFALDPEGTVRVEASTAPRNGQSSTVTGTVTLNPISNPAFDLTLSANNFRAVGRRDISGRVTGDVRLTGTYQQPLVEGTLTAEEGVLFIDEFVRSASVVSLFDTTFGAIVPSAERPNRFLQGLRADVTLAVDRNSWLRSQRFNQSMNVELAGEVQLTFDRAQRTLAMFGDLEAIRGTYTTVGRSFAIESGDVTFVGTPGVNPNLAFMASHRARTPQGPLDITATVTGTLLTPVVRLSSGDQALSESDLYGYLLFNRPTSALSRDQQAFIQGATGFAVGTIFSQLGSLLAEDIPIDYLAISTSEFLDQPSVGQGLRSEAAATGVEIGKYFYDDVFVGVLWRPFGPQGAANRDSFSGRIEWRFRPGWALEAFAEDRFLRGSFSGFEQLGFNLSKVWGMFVFRQFGY